MTRMYLRHVRDLASKSNLRATALAARDALSGEQRAAAAQAVAARGLPFEIAPGTVVAGYSPIRSEIDPLPLMRKLAAQGARLALPADDGARPVAGIPRLVARRPRCVLGPLGILEPSPAPAEIIPDIMLVPLAAFDRAGHRIGYGAGHYDCTLAQLRETRSRSSPSVWLSPRRKSRPCRRSAARRRAGLCANGERERSISGVDRFAHSFRR